MTRNGRQNECGRCRLRAAVADEFAEDVGCQAGIFWIEFHGGVDWLSDPEVGGKDVSQAFQSSMDEESDVSRGEAGDLMDVLIAEALLEFECDDLALVVREAGEVTC